MASQFDLYQMKRTPLSDAEFNKRWKNIDLRLVGLEETAFTFAENQNELTALALQRINEALTPVIIEAQNFAHLGDLLRARSFTEQSIALGVQSFSITEADRNTYAAPLYVIISVTADTSKWMAGNTLSYDKNTGLLVVNITNTRDVGSYDDWTITIAGIPPELPPATSAEDIALSGVSGITAANVRDAFIEQQADITDLYATKVAAANAALTGNPTAPTQTTGNNSTRLATTAFVAQALDAFVAGAPGALDTLNELAAALGDDANYAATIAGQMALKAPLASPAFSGTPAAPTAAGGNNTTQLATTAFVQSAVSSGVSSKANIASPTFTGTPAAPTASVATNTTQLATTAFVQAVAAATGGINLGASITTFNETLAWDTGVVGTGTALFLLKNVSTVHGDHMMISLNGGTNYSVASSSFGGYSMAIVVVQAGAVFTCALPRDTDGASINLPLFTRVVPTAGAGNIKFFMSASQNVLGIRVL